MTQVPYTLEQVEEDLATLRGQVDRLTEVLQMGDMVAPGPNNPATGHIRYGLGGHAKYASSDGTDYNTGGYHATGTGQSVASTSDVDVTGIGRAISVAAIKYRVSGVLIGSQGGAAFANNIGFSGPAITRCTIAYLVIEGTSIFASGALSSLTTFSTGVIPALTTFEAWFHGTIEFSAAGTNFGMRVNQGTAGHLWNVTADSSLDIWPIT